MGINACVFEMNALLHGKLGLLREREKVLYFFGTYFLVHKKRSHVYSKHTWKGNIYFLKGNFRNLKPLSISMHIFVVWFWWKERKFENHKKGFCIYVASSIQHT